MGNLATIAYMVALARILYSVTTEPTPYLVDREPIA
jgi:hypothetical protein